MRTRHLVPVLALLLALLPAIWPDRAWALTFAVDTTADAADATPGDGLCATAAGSCALRAAVQEANALVGADTIVLVAGTYVLTLIGPAEDAAASGDLDVTESLTLVGAGAGSTILDGNAASRVIEVIGALPPNFPTVEIEALTVRNGRVQDGDACDSFFSFPGGDGLCGNAVFLSLTEVIVEQNLGDGVLVVGALTLTRSVVRDNDDGTPAGDTGIVTIAPTLSIVDSTISGNDGLGLSVGPFGSSVDIRNSTISGNGGTGISAGGICEPPQIECGPLSPVALLNVTVSGHSSSGVFNEIRVFPGGDVFHWPVSVQNSLFAGNGSACTGGLMSSGHNLFDVVAGCALSGAGTGDLVGVPGLLGPLAANGGPTDTQALLARSPAINAGDPGVPGSGGSACEATDQRGVARPVGTRCDIGAFESSCGDALADPGEECDDGNAIDGDGCQHNCTLPGCGNGVLEPAEACDDANRDGGDCCSSTCTFDALGTACADDDNECTSDACDGVGTCQHENNTAPCEDGDPCSPGDICSDGSCVATASCGPCLECDPGVGCVEPAAVCHTAAPRGSSIALLDRPGDARDTARWSWRGTQRVSKSEWGFPSFIAVGYGLCLYDATGEAHLLLNSGAGCEGGFGYCWQETGNGFALSSTQVAEGVFRARLLTTTPGRASVYTRGTIEGVPPLPLQPPVRLRLFRTDTGSCWDARYDAGVGENTPQAFRARSD